jgi:hypothetical protein
MRNEKPAFCAVLAWIGLFPAAIPYPTGDMRGQERAGLPPKIDAGNKKSLFLDALKFRKAEKSPIAKKYGYMRLWNFV